MPLITRTRCSLMGVMLLEVDRNFLFEHDENIDAERSRAHGYITVQFMYRGKNKVYIFRNELQSGPLRLKCARCRCRLFGGVISV